jgi:NAD+ synthase/NAD+ synthase (glutamine-hydrolysing)
VKIGLGQINPTVGDFRGNAAKIIDYSRRAAQAGAGLILFPELCICGYPPRDLVERPEFLQRNRETALHIAQQTRGISVVCGLVTRATSNTGKTAMNSAVLLRDGEIVFQQSKRLLPTYDVFDELRNFEPAASQQVFSMCGKQWALTICEDAWNDKSFWERQLYSSDPVEELVRAGGEFILNISASPYHNGKRELRERMFQAIARRHNRPVVLVNQVGGNDSVIFDGTSLVVAPDGHVIAQACSFEEDLVFFDTESLAGDRHELEHESVATDYTALVLGTRDYVRKCGFQKVIIGLSGGIDSALTACIAVDALGAENVMGVAMPGPYSSRSSLDDAQALANNLGISLETVRITETWETLRRSLRHLFEGRREDETEENMQARLRGTILMSLSNKFGALVLSTGNKSELAVGYCTLYGDMAGGLAVISDVPKVRVYELSRYVNSRRAVIPQSTITKPPSAELRPNQKDTDSLPDYEILDPILEDYIEDLKQPEQIAHERGVDPELVRRIVRMVNRSEYKRQQAAPGLKISSKAFGMGRRLPIAQRWEL